MNLPTRLKSWREVTSLTQQKAANLFGVPLTTYQRWEYGVHTPSAPALKFIESELNRSPAG